MTFNLNVNARVILTVAGAAHLNRITQTQDASEGDVVSCEFWRLMRDFGPAIGAWLSVPFLFNEIDLDIYD